MLDSGRVSTFWWFQAIFGKHSSRSQLLSNGYIQLFRGIPWLQPIWKNIRIRQIGSFPQEQEKQTRHQMLAVIMNMKSTEEVSIPNDTQNAVEKKQQRGTRSGFYSP